jgi:hypothetical protein
VRTRFPWLPRLIVALVTSLSLISVIGVTPATADVYDSCNIDRCSDARSANETWADLGYPTSRDWYSWPDGQSNFAGGEFENREGQLPDGATYNEYDVYPRDEGAPRDAYRIVVNRDTGVTWFSPNHYTDFYRL